MPFRSGEDNCAVAFTCTPRGRVWLILGTRTAPRRRVALISFIMAFAHPLPLPKRRKVIDAAGTTTPSVKYEILFRLVALPPPAIKIKAEDAQLRSHLRLGYSWLHLGFELSPVRSETGLSYVCAYAFCVSWLPAVLPRGGVEP